MRQKLSRRILQRRDLNSPENEREESPFMILSYA